MSMVITKHGMKEKRKFQFFVGDNYFVRSSLWNVIASRNDLMLIATAWGDDFKVTLHKSGECHSALTSEYAKRSKIRNQERYFARWSVAPKCNIADIAFRIIIPYSQTANFFGIEYPKEDCIHIPAPKEGYCCEIFVYKVANLKGLLEIENGRTPVRAAFDKCSALPMPKGLTKFAVIEMIDGSGYIFAHTVRRFPKENNDSIQRISADFLKDRMLVVKEKKRAGFLTIAFDDGTNGVLLFYT